MTIENYHQVITDSYYQAVFLRTFAMAGLVTLISVLIGVPQAYVLSLMSERMRAVTFVIVLGPLLISVVVRTLGWAVLLGNEGLINKALMGLGLIESPIKLMYTFTGMVIAMVHVLVPLMVMAVWASLQKLDTATIYAAESLGASMPRIMIRVVFPQLIPGILSGSLIVFSLAASSFATPSIIGGRRLKVVSTAIYDEFLATLNWPLGAALSVILLIIVLVLSVGLNRWIERRFKQVFQ